MSFIIILAGIFLLLALTINKVNPFIAIIIVAIAVGLGLGMSPSEVIATIEKGIGNTLGGLTLILCFGAILGKILEKSGATQRITDTLINKFGEKHIQWAVVLTGFMVGIPLFYNAGFIILVPLVLSIAVSTGLPVLYLAIPMAASLSVTHGFLPPHPGPVALINILGADLGKTMIYGFILSIPIVILGGPVLGRFMKGMKLEINPKLFSNERIPEENLPPVSSSFIIALLPIILIGASVILTSFLGDSDALTPLIKFIGNANVALLLSVLIAIYYLGTSKGKSMTEVMKWSTDSVSGIAMILLIIAAGGAFKQILVDSGTADLITAYSSKWNINPLVFGWLVAVLIRLTIGSATVAGITAAGIVLPLLATGVNPSMLVLAVGAGSLFGSHVNDTGFWMFKEFFNASMKQTFLSWTLMETVISILGLFGVLLLNNFV